MQVASIDETLDRISAKPGVVGVVISTRDAIPIRTTLDNTATAVYIGAMGTLEERAASLIRDLDPTNHLISFRVRASKQEIMLKIEPDYMILVLQKCKQLKRGGLYSF